MSRPSHSPTGPARIPAMKSGATAEPGQPEAAVGGDALETVDRSATLREGWRLYGAGSLEEARRLMISEAASSPQDSEAAYLLGMIFKAQGDVPHAAQAFAAAKRTVASQADRTRGEMIQRLAQANIELMNPAAAERGTRHR